MYKTVYKLFENMITSIILMISKKFSVSQYYLTINYPYNKNVYQIWI